MGLNTMSPVPPRILAGVIAVLVLTLPVLAENIVYPANSGVIDLTVVHKAPRIGEGDGDATVEIQQALDAYVGSNRTLYLPNGTYLVSNTLKWGFSNGSGAEEKNMTLQGQSTVGTVIMLKASCPGFGDSSVPKGVIWTGDAPAQRFRNNIRNLTVLVGSGNPGACGIQYMSNNQGHLMDVAIVSADKQGHIGLDLGYTAENGPLYVRNVRISGFDYGIVAGAPQNSQTLEHITIENQRILGIANFAQVLTIRDLVSVNRVPVLRNDVPAVTTLIDASLTVPAGDTVPTAAISNYAWLYARNITTRGYRQAITGRNPGDQDMLRRVVDEYRSDAALSLFSSPATSLNLPVEEPPRPVWDPPEQWVSPMQYGGVGNGSTDDTSPLQQAIDAGKSTVYLTGGKTFRVNGTVYVRGAVRTIIGLEGQLTGSGTFQVQTGTHDTVYFMHPSSFLDPIKLRHSSARTLVVEGTTGVRYVADAGAGKVFLTDYCASPFSFSAGQKAFLRQVNPEGLETKIVSNGATVWLLGLKTERAGTIFQTTNGTAELHGIFTYATEGAATMPMIRSTNSRMSVTTYGGSCFTAALCWQTMIEETRGGETRTLTRDKLPTSTRTGEPVLTLYTGYAATGVALGNQSARAFSPRRNAGSRWIVSSPRETGGLGLGASSGHDVTVYNTRGQSVGVLRTGEGSRSQEALAATAGVFFLRPAVREATRR